LVRYADDFVIVCEDEDDARGLLTALSERLRSLGLTLHPEKTRLVDCRRPSPDQGGGRRETFDFLGFTHGWGRSRKGGWVVKRKTAKDRFSRTLKRLAGWCRSHRHLPVKEQHRRLCQGLRGHDAYFGITGNWPALDRLHRCAERIWRKWLDRRSDKAKMTWEKFAQLLKRYPLPVARVVQSVYGRQLQLPLRT